MGEFVELDLADLVRPADGARAMVDRWWLTRNGRPVVWRRGRHLTPQCNHCKDVVELIAARSAEFGVLHVPMAFWSDPAGQEY